jgi:hypothetical protein
MASSLIRGAMRILALLFLVLKCTPGFAFAAFELIKYKIKKSIVFRG